MKKVEEIKVTTIEQYSSSSSDGSSSSDDSSSSEEAQVEIKENGSSVSSEDTSSSEEDEENEVVCVLLDEKKFVPLLTTLETEMVISFKSVVLVNWAPSVVGYKGKVLSLTETNVVFSKLEYMHEKDIPLNENGEQDPELDLELIVSRKDMQSINVLL